MPKEGKKVVRPGRNQGLITIPGNPISVNRIYMRGAARMRGVILAGEARAWKDHVGWCAKTDWKDPVLTGRLRVVLTLFLKDRRRRDIANCEKLIMDALEGICFRDDSQIDDMRILRRHDKRRPRIEVRIEEITAN